ncbi:isopentenyl-diphosphate Delta-isomerase [Pseudonocardia phyllosphaerae]|uniref:isopentenyl-diphosphate Delta-isomerase n=1 Tax=Pseudonocardia phyllosphaerae TaxID=3390502 RepID=UPI00397AB1E8
MEQVVLLDDDGNAIGVADKATVHGASTPRHLAFSCYGVDGAGRLLVTRRAGSKTAFPLVWTNTCCGHPGPGEDIADAVHRRLHDELGLRASELRLALPEFSYRASQDGVEENELCPVYLARLDGEPAPHPDEVSEVAWWTWEQFRAAADDPASGLSPWARLQAPLLDALGDPLLSRA